MKVSKIQAQQNREKIIQKATQLFRAHGYDGIGIADLMSGAGFTHGGFYKHFSSKTDLISITVKNGVQEILHRIHDLDLNQFIRLYVSRTHRDHRDLGCSLTALSCDAARQADEVKVEFETGIEKLIEFITDDLRKNQKGSIEDQRKKAIGILAESVGAIVLSRACLDDSKLADEILEACRSNLLIED
ncbi:TetR/AcrR family transcriptional regulator [Acinetobacter guerrae]|uniref:TetR/AcrR family transcriptional regulator n=1 Tax=Acinetobacter guerrae TaxID=1843371 RepID=UPI00128DDC4F|nr:TetR/AcrR family transcriptional regulator [Acinetobacter guerrae]MPW45258.1 TetR family transcriptional regulator [Acinetobacter guerrae]